MREDRMGVGPQLQENAQSVGDATVVSDKVAPVDDATIVVGQRPGARAEADMTASALAKKSTSPGADDSTSARRSGGAKSGARSTGAGGGGFLGSIASALVSKGLLPEREAISLALRARDLGYTLFYAMALDPVLGADEKLYAGLADSVGTRFISSRRELLETIADVSWLDAKSAEQRGVL